MGTELRVRIEGRPHAEAVRAAEVVFEEVSRVERVLSTWDPAAELSWLNRTSVGSPALVSTDLLEFLLEARRWAAATGGAFEPAVGALVDLWDLRGVGRRPSAHALAGALQDVGPDAVEIAATGIVVRRRPSAWIDSGAFGKGAALRAAARVLRDLDVDRAVLDFGGQLSVLGPARRVAVAHPSRRDQPILSLSLSDASAATTSQSERWVEVGGERIGHVLDPRTGRPVPAWGSVTVVSADPLAADALSTALFVMGPVDGLAWAESRHDVGALFLRDGEGRPHPTWNDAMERWLGSGSTDPSGASGPGPTRRAGVAP